MKLAHEKERERAAVEVIGGSVVVPESHAAAECPVCSSRVFPNFSGEERIGCVEHPDAATARNAATKAVADITATCTLCDTVVSGVEAACVVPMCAACKARVQAQLDKGGFLG